MFGLFLSFTSTLVPEERELWGVVGSPCPGSGSAGGVCHHQQNLVWDELFLQALPNVGTGVSALLARVQRGGTSGQSQGRRGEAHLVAEMSFSNTAGSKKRDLSRD